MPMTPTLFVYMGEVRVFALDSTQSFGPLFKCYRGVTTNLIQAVTGYANIVQLDMNDASKTVANPAGISFTIERCNSG